MAKIVAEFGFLKIKAALTGRCGLAHSPGVRPWGAGPGGGPAAALGSRVLTATGQPAPFHSRKPTSHRSPDGEPNARPQPNPSAAPWQGNESGPPSQPPHGVHGTEIDGEVRQKYMPYDGPTPESKQVQR